jgi:putative nucleotidyltransferase with HDIG domain
LPPAPRVLLELLEQLGRPNVDASRIEELIKYDPALTASVLLLCNSAALAAATPVENLDEAIVRLGFQQLYSLVAVASIARGLSRRPRVQKATQNDLWSHSLVAAVAAQAIARDVGEDDKLAFTAALLHDLGKLILTDALEQGYSKLCHDVQTARSSLFCAELTAFGVQHAQIGGRVLERWGFPGSLVAAVCFHHDPAAAPSHQRLAAQVHLGNAVAYLLGRGYGQHVLAPHGQTDAMEILHLPEGCLARFQSETESQLSTIQRYLQIAA